METRVDARARSTKRRTFLALNEDERRLNASSLNCGARASFRRNAVHIASRDYEGGSRSLLPSRGELMYSATVASLIGSRSETGRSLWAMKYKLWYSIILAGF